MTLFDFLQWLGVGGVAIFSVLNIRKGNIKSNEQEFITKLQSEIERKEERLDFINNQHTEAINRITKRLDDIESENRKLREENYKLRIERDSSIRERTALESNLYRKINKLESEKRTLKLKIDDLVLENEKLK